MKKLAAAYCDLIDIRKYTVVVSKADGEVSYILQVKEKGLPIYEIC